VNVIEEKFNLKGDMLKGRQIAFMLYHSYRVTDVEGGLLDFTDLLAVTLKGDNVRGFINDWELRLSGLRTMPAPNIMESLFRKQLDTSHQLENTMELYTLDITQRGEQRSYEQLMNEQQPTWSDGVWTQTETT